MDMTMIAPVGRNIPWIRHNKKATLFFDYLSLGLCHDEWDIDATLRFIEKDAKENGVKILVERLSSGVRITVKDRKFPFLPYTDEEADDLGLPRYIPRKYGMTKKLKEMKIGDVVYEHPNERRTIQNLANQAGIKVSCEKLSEGNLKVTRTE
jgi:hypothetical protein